MKKARNLAVATTLLLSGLSANQAFASGLESNSSVFKMKHSIEGPTSTVYNSYSPNQQVASITVSGLTYGVTTSSNSIIKNGFMDYNKVLDTLSSNQPLTVLEEKNGHYRVIAPEIRGWMPVSNVRLQSTPVPYTEQQAVAKINGSIIQNGYMPHNYQVGTLGLNEHVRIIDLKNGYYRVISEHSRGWVKMGDLQIMPSGSVYYGLTTNSKTEVKNGYSDSNNTIATLTHNEPLTVLETKSGYHRVIAPYTRGWIKTTSVNIRNEAIPYTKQNGVAIAGNVTVQNGYMPHNYKVGTLNSNQEVEIIDLKNGYYRIIANNTRGWVSFRSIQVTGETAPPPPVTINTKDGIVTTSTLNVRTGPSINYDAIGSLSFNSDVEILTEQNGWFKVQYDGLTGWVSGAYIDVIPDTKSSYQFINLRKPSNVTAAQINTYISNYETLYNTSSIFSGKGQSFIDIARKYGVNELFFAAFAIHESGFGTSSIAKSKHNLFGLGAFDSSPFDSAYHFTSINQNLEYEAAFLRHKYLSPSPTGGWWQYKGAYLGDKNGGMNVYYASDSLWGQKIASHMEKILAYDSNYYNNANTFNVGTPSYSIPDYTENYPNGILATAKQTLTLYLSKNGGKSVITIPAGDVFAVTAKTNDYWIQLRYNGNTYWTTFSFSRYKDYINIRNLIRIQVDGGSLNVRENSSTTSNILSQLSDYTHVEGIVDSNNNLVTSGSWYKIKTPDGIIGWVHTDYARRVYP